MTERPFIRCHLCRRTSFHPKDVEHRYCGGCGTYHEYVDAYTLGTISDEQIATVKATLSKGNPMITHEIATMKSYRHYKGGTYTLLMVARSSEERDKFLAVYVSHQTQQVWVRPWEMFNEPVHWPDGRIRPRFSELPQDVTSAMEEIPT